MTTAAERARRIREQATRPRRTVAILCDGEVRGQIEAVEDELDRLERLPVADQRQNSRSHDARRTELEAEVAHLREAALDMTLFVVLEGMDRTAYRALVGQHPPRKGDDGKVDPRDLAGANTETLQVPLIRACIVGQQDGPDASAKVVPLDKPTVDWLLGDGDVPPFATDRQVERLYAAALIVCRGDEAVPLSRRRSPATTTSADA